MLTEQYMMQSSAGLCSRRSGLPASERSRQYHSALQAHFDRPGFPCIGARVAVRRSSICMGLFDTLGSPGSAAALCADLALFWQDLSACKHVFMSYVAVFEGPRIDDERHFEALLWKQLQALHDHDAQHFPWDATVDADPSSADFAFSIAGKAWFVVGMNPTSERKARYLPFPALIFNARVQFEQLRRDGRYAPMQRAIRNLDKHFSGSINSNLLGEGTSDSRQYAGRIVENDWECPLHVHSSSQVAPVPGRDSD